MPHAPDPDEDTTEDEAWAAGWGWDPVEQGMYDDDPNPYHGDYSEM